jgi:glycosyltransferase involved in cell wall biosynthesis
MGKSPLNIFLYPYNLYEPYILLLGRALQRINPQIKIYWDELYRGEIKFTTFPPHSFYNSIIHLHWIPEYSHYFGKKAYRMGYFQTELLYGKVAKSMLLILKMKKKYGVKVIWTIHNADNPSLHMRPTWISFWHRVVNRLSDGYIFHCRSAQKDFFEKGNRLKPSFVIPHGNFINVYGPIVKDRIEAKRILGITENMIVFLILGWIKKSKNLDWLIPNLKNLDFPYIRFIIAGDALEEPGWLIKECINDKRFIFMQYFIPNYNLRWILAAADFLINAQTRGYTSASNITALSYGLPVIGIDWGCASQIIRNGENGFLYTQDTFMEVLKQAIALRQDSNKYEKMRYSTLETMRQDQYSWEKIAKKTLDAYWAILKT